MTQSPKKTYLAIVISTLCLQIAACTPDLDLDQVGDLGPDIQFEEFEASLPRHPDSSYVVEVDLPIRTVDELRAYYETNLGNAGSALIAERSGQDAACWNTSERRSLTYCVDRRSLGTHYTAVAQAMREATSDWEAAANVNFRHVSSLDNRCQTAESDVVFRVVRGELAAGVHGRSFTPGTLAEFRKLEIDDRTYPAVETLPGYTLRGLVLHELGHILGFLHEHARPEAEGTCRKFGSWNPSIPLTEYDRMSVMHYPGCRVDNTDYQYSLSDLDKSAAATLYGQPGRSTDQGTCVNKVHLEPKCTLTHDNRSVRWSITNASQCSYKHNGTTQTIPCRNGSFPLSSLQPGTNSLALTVSNQAGRVTCEETIVNEAPLPTCSLREASGRLWWNISNASTCSWKLDGGSSNPLDCSNGSVLLSDFGGGRHRLELDVANRTGSRKCSRTIEAH